MRGPGDRPPTGLLVGSTAIALTHHAPCPLAVVDGVSTGSNDLTQFVLGVDRDSELCAELYDETDSAVLEATNLRQLRARAHRGCCASG